MRAIIPHTRFGTHRVMFPIPAVLDDQGLSLTEWVMSSGERERLICGGHMRLWVYTNLYTQPIVVEVMEPDSPVKES